MENLHGGCVAQQRRILWLNGTIIFQACPERVGNKFSGRQMRVDASAVTQSARYGVHSLRRLVINDCIGRLRFVSFRCVPRALLRKILAAGHPLDDWFMKQAIALTGKLEKIAEVFCAGSELVLSFPRGNISERSRANCPTHFPFPGVFLQSRCQVDIGSELGLDATKNGMGNPKAFGLILFPNV